MVNQYERAFRAWPALTKTAAEKATIIYVQLADHLGIHPRPIRFVLARRPARGAPDPDHTNPDWCVYDEPTGWYRYTKAYVKHLVKKCSTPEGFEEATGMKPRPIV